MDGFLSEVVELGKFNSSYPPEPFSFGGYTLLGIEEKSNYSTLNLMLSIEEDKDDPTPELAHGEPPQAAGELRRSRSFQPLKLLLHTGSPNIGRKSTHPLIFC